MRDRKRNSLRASPRWLAKPNLRRVWRPLLSVPLLCGLPLLSGPFAVPTQPPATATNNPTQATPSAEKLLPGIWRGVETTAATTYHLRLDVKRDGKGYTADGIAWTAMTEAQADAVLRGELSPSAFAYVPANNAVLPACLREKFTVSVDGDTVTFQGDAPSVVSKVMVVTYSDNSGRPGRETHVIATRYDNADGVFVELMDEPPAPPVAVIGGDGSKVSADTPAPPARRLFGRERSVVLEQFKNVAPEKWVGKLTASGVIFPKEVDAPEDGTAPKKAADRRMPFFRLGRADALTGAAGGEKIETGGTRKLACLEDPTYHYTCYLPLSFEPGKPTPILVNSSPSGNAQPLSEGMAEKLGWIMVGLTESQNGPAEPNWRCRDAVLFDLRRRFRVEGKQVYFSGFSGGARAAAQAALTYPDLCAGVLCIGASCLARRPPLNIPIYLLTGQTDMNRPEVTRCYDEERRAGRKVQLAIHPSGHSWGRPVDHNVALLWLAENSRPAGTESKPPPSSP